MNKFKDHVTTEINSLGIFSLTINATLIICMVCITNLLNFKHIIIALSPLMNLITSVLSTGLILIGIYSKQHSYYVDTIPTWSSNLLISLGVILFFVGVLGYTSQRNLNRKNILIHILVLIICIILLIITCVGFFSIAEQVDTKVNTNWNVIEARMKLMGFEIRKSFLINQIEINLKFAGFFSLVFIVFSLFSFWASLYQHYFI